MKILLEVNDNKASFLMEVLKNFSFVKTTQLTDAKAEFMKELKESIDQVKLAKKGKVKLKSGNDLLDEL